MSTSFLPDIRVEIAFNAGYATPAASRTWTDVSSYVEAQHGVSIDRGRSDEFADIQPSRLSLVLDNADGRFTPGLASGANYPNVKIGRPIRVSATWNSVTYRLFTGYVDEWTPTWPGTTTGSAVVTVTASSRLALLARKILANFVQEEILHDGPVMYYPLSEPTGSTEASSLSTTPQEPIVVTQTGTGGTLSFGTGTGPTTDGLTAPTFARADASDGLYLYNVIRNSPTSGGVGDVHLALECWFKTTAAGAGLVMLWNYGSVNAVQMQLTGGKLVASISGTTNLTGSTTVNDGLLHHAVFKVDLNGSGGYTRKLLLDGNVEASDSGTGVGTSFGAFTDLFVGALAAASAPASSPFDGTLAQVAVYNTSVADARFQSHATAGSTGFLGEASEARIARLASYGGVAASEISTETGGTTAMSFVDITGANLQSALLDVVHTENGLVFDAGDGTLTFHSRNHRYDVSSVATFTAATQEIGADLTPQLDDFGMVNDATYTGGGVTVRAVDASSVADRGTYADSGDLQTANPYEVADRANWAVYSRAQPKVRYSTLSLEVEVLSSAQITAALDIEIGDLITIAGLPTNAPASSVNVFVEGISTKINGVSYVVTFNLSPSDFYVSPGVWKLGDANFGQLGQTTILGY